MRILNSFGPMTLSDEIFAAPQLSYQTNRYRRFLVRIKVMSFTPGTKFNYVLDYTFTDDPTTGHHEGNSLITSVDQIYEKGFSYHLPGDNNRGRCLVNSTVEVDGTVTFYGQAVVHEPDEPYEEWSG